MPDRLGKPALTVLSLGAGVQSSTLLLMADAGEIGPRPDAAIFADTGWEPDAVYTHLDWLETQTSIPIYRVSNGRNLYEDTWNGQDNAGRLFTDIPVYSLTPRGEMQLARRQCTGRYKIRPIQAKIRELLDRRKGVRTGPMALQLIGISKDEAHRMKPSGVSWIESAWPLIDVGMTRVDCMRWFEARYPGRPLVKSSCVGCPFHSDAEWLRLADANHTEMDAAIALDHRLRSPNRPRNPNTKRLPEYLHKSGTPLETVIAKLRRNAAEGRQLTMLDGFGNECEGHCGV